MLVALFTEAHVHHQLAHDWFADHAAHGWASCPLTENGLVRILGNPRRVEQHVPIPLAVSLLAQFRRNSTHQFWPDDVSLTDGRLIDPDGVQGHQQVGDLYLLALAVKHGGRLVTLDAAIPLSSVKGAGRERLVVLAPAA
jgi:toxin-antitoxin system PIN domain toxin